MATVTSKATGLWSAGSTWDSDPAIPVNGDTVIIAVGDEVTFDVDQSGFATGVDLTVTGTLTCSTAAGTYYLMCSADLDGAGTFNAGSSGTALPQTVKFTVDFTNGNFHFLGSGGLTLLFYCTEPTNTFVVLDEVEPAGETVMSCLIDVTADIWAVGNDVAICDMNKGKDVDKTTIAAGGIAATSITVDDVLASQKEIGSYLVLLNRNITVRTGTVYAFQSMDSTCIINCEIEQVASGRGSNSCTGTTFGGTIWQFGTSNLQHHGNTSCTYTGVFNGLSGDPITSDSGAWFSGLIVGCSEGLNALFSSTITGEIRGCNFGHQGCKSCSFTTTCIIDNCNRGSDSSYGNAYYNTTSNCNRASSADYSSLFSGSLTGNTVDLYECGSGQSFNTAFGGGTEFSGYNGVKRGKLDYFSSEDHDQVTNAFKAWCRGGIVTSQTASPPTGYTIWYEHACEDTDPEYPCFRQFETVVQPGTTVEVVGKIRIADGEVFAGDDIPPRLQIIDKFADPLVDSTQSALDEDIIGSYDGTNVDWQDVDVIWANTGDAPRTVYVRMLCYSDEAGATDIDEVWAVAGYKDDITTILSVVRPLNTTVSASDSTTSFTLTAGVATADAYNNMTIQVQDADDADGNWIERSITDWTAGRVVTIDTALPFTPAVGDLVRITATSYSGATAVDLTPITDKLPTNFIMGSSDQTDKDDEIDAILADVTGINGDVMRGTDGANTTVPDTAGTAAGLHTTTDGLIAALNDPTLDAIADAVNDEIVEGTITLRQGMRLMLSVLTGKASGGGTTAINFRDIGDTKNRIEATVDSDGNRTAIGTRDGT